MGKLYNDMRPHKLCLDPGSLHEIELYLSTVSRTPHDSHIKVLCIKKIGLWKERGLRSMFFIWFITSWAHTFIIASAVAITWQALWTQSKHIEIYHDTNGSLAKPTHWYSLSLRLCSWPELHVLLQQQNAGGTAVYTDYTDFLHFTQSLCRKDSSSLLCTVLHKFKMRWEWKAQPAWLWLCPGCTQECSNSWLQADGAWELQLSSSACIKVCFETALIWGEYELSLCWGTSLGNIIFIPLLPVLVLH